MANKDASDLFIRLVHSGTWGNKTAEVGVVTTGGAEAIGDDLRFLVIPANSRVFQLAFTADDIGGAGATLSFGYAPVDGSTAVPAAFIPATSVAAAVTTPVLMTGSKLSVLVAKDSYLIARVAGAALNAVGAVNIDISWVFGGHA